MHREQLGTLLFQYACLVAWKVLVRKGSERQLAHPPVRKGSLKVRKGSLPTRPAAHAVPLLLSSIYSSPDKA